MANKIFYGISNVYYSVVTESLNTSGQWVETYGTPKALKGAVGITLPASNESIQFAADNDANYFMQQVFTGYTGGSLELRYLDDTFRKDVLGNTDDDNNILVENINDQPKFIALLFQFEGDATKTRHCLYRVSVGAPDTTSTTKTTTIPEVTVSLPLTAGGRLSDGVVKSKADETANAAQYAAWFNAVYTPVNS